MMPNARKLMLPFSKTPNIISCSIERDKMFLDFTEKGQPGFKLRKIYDRVINELDLP